MQRHGITIPFDSVPLAEQRDWIAEVEQLGYTDVWSAEADATDAFTPLVLASQWAPTLRLGTAIVPAYTRAPGVLAQQIATLAAVAPGRVAFGVGASSNVIVERWNGVPFEDPYRRVRDTVRFLRPTLAGEKTDFDGSNLSSHGFRLKIKGLDTKVPILVAALREGMLRLAGREGDGAIINWLSANDVRQVAPIVQEASPDGSHKEIAARIFVVPSTDRELVMNYSKFAIAAYLNVAVYAAFHEWLGRGEMLAPMWKHWREGDRAAAVAAIPDELVDELVVWGNPEACREHIGRYVEAGVDTTVLAILNFGIDERQAIRDLAPR